MLQSFLTFLRIVVFIGSFVGIFYLLNLVGKKWDFWKKAGVAMFAAFFFAAIFTNATKTADEEKAEAEQARQRQIEKVKQEKTEKAAAKKEAAKKRLNFSKEERDEAKNTVQRSIDAGILIKIQNHGDSLISLWADRKFDLLPFDIKENLCKCVCVAYFKSVDGYIGLYDGYTGKEIGHFALNSGLKME